jgi:hypothetical protein
MSAMKLLSEVYSQGFPIIADLSIIEFNEKNPQYFVNN